MQQTVFRNWTFTRALYSLAGVFIIIQSVIGHEWAGVLLGGYFALMGIFSFGCAAGNCRGGNERLKNNAGPKPPIEDIEFEELKTR